MRIDIFKDGKGYATDEVSTVKISEANSSEENRIKFVTDLAAVSRGNNKSKNPPVRYKQLLKEAAPTDDSIRVYKNIQSASLKGHCSKPKIEGSPSRPLEFLPVVLRLIYDTSESGYDILLYGTGKDGEFVIGLKHEDYSNKISKYSYVKGNRVYTNMRACLNAGIPYERVPYNTPDELTEFKAIKAKIPMFIWAQVPNTHTAISKEAQSDRVAVENDYWLPEDFRERTYNYVNERTDSDGILLKGAVIGKVKFFQVAKECLTFENKDDVINLLLTGGKDELHLSQVEMCSFFTALGYKDEISQRAIYYFKYKEVVMTGWNVDPNVWQHLFVERSTESDVWKNWTQKETIKVVETFKTLI